MDAGMPNSSGTKFGRNPQQIQALWDVNAKQWRQWYEHYAFACTDEGMPNALGTKFGLNPKVNAGTVGR